MLRREDAPLRWPCSARTSACLPTRIVTVLEVVLVDFYFFAVYFVDFLDLLTLLLVMVMLKMPVRHGSARVPRPAVRSSSQPSRCATRR